MTIEPARAAPDPQPARHPDPSPIGSDILSALRRVIRAIDRHSHHLVQSCGLTGPQALLLKEIAAAGTLSAGELAQRVSLSQATITDIVKRLEARGLVTRPRDPLDRRRVILRLTEQGKATLAASPPLLQERFLSRLAELPAAEQQGLLKALQRIAAMMDAEHLDASPVLTSGAIAASAEAVARANATDDGTDF